MLNEIIIERIRIINYKRPKYPSYLTGNVLDSKNMKPRKRSEVNLNSLPKP